LPISLPFKTVIYLQISYFSGVRSSKFYFWQLSNNLRQRTI
jgi:hypothetical protein